MTPAKSLLQTSPITFMEASASKEPRWYNCRHFKWLSGLLIDFCFQQMLCIRKNVSNCANLRSERNVARTLAHWPNSSTSLNASRFESSASHQQWDSNNASTLKLINKNHIVYFTDWTCSLKTARDIGRDMPRVHYQTGTNLEVFLWVGRSSVVQVIYAHRRTHDWRGGGLQTEILLRSMLRFTRLSIHLHGRGLHSYE